MRLRPANLCPDESCAMEKHWIAVSSYFDALSHAGSLTGACRTIQDILRSIVAAYDRAELGTLTEQSLAKLALTAESRPPVLSESTAALVAELLRLEAAGSPWSTTVKASVTAAARQLAMDVQYFAYTITGDYFCDLPGVVQLAGFAETNRSPGHEAMPASTSATDEIKAPELTGHARRVRTGQCR